MKIQLLIATAESDYSEYLSDALSTNYADDFSVGTCTSPDRLSIVLAEKRYDVILVEPEWIPSLNKNNAKLVLVLWGEQASIQDEMQDITKVKKYQRISLLVSDIFEHFAHVASGRGDIKKDGARIVAVWSPAGGVGKTTVALAYATRVVSNGGTAIYLDFEHFSSEGAFFARSGKSISTLFERLSLNADIVAKSIIQHDSGSGVNYFNPPNNYDDINELTTEDMIALVNICAEASDVTVIDLPCVCDKKTQAILEQADIVLLVFNGRKTAEAKLDVFMSQNSIFEDIRGKTHFVLNDGATSVDDRFEKVIRLPHVQSGDPVSVYKTLSANSFDIVYKH